MEWSEYTMRHKWTNLLCASTLLSIIATASCIPRAATTSVQAAQPCVPTTAGTVPVTVNLAAPTTPTVTAFAVNIQQADELAPNSAKQRVDHYILQQMQPAYARLHFSVHGDTFGSIPEIVQGQWDFTHLDNAVAALRAEHQPFFLNVRSAPAWMFNSQGNLRDPSFNEFATYMARLVGWYNKGGFTDDNGVYHHSGHYGWITTWEIWNEPNSGYEIPAPVADPSATWMQAANFARLYDVTTAAMRAVDPTIQTGGPTVSSYPDNPYIQTFVHDIREPLNFLSFHFYAIGAQSEPDTEIFNEVLGQRLLDRIVAIQKIVQQEKPTEHIPLWIDELGFNEIARLPVDPRGTSLLAYAYVATVFTLLEEHGVALYGQFPVLGDAQQSLANYQTLAIYPIFWLYVNVNHAFPPGMAMVPVSSTTGLSALAALTPDKKHLRLMLGNIRVKAPTDNNGTGVAQQVCITIAGLPSGAHTAQVWTYDAQTLKHNGPATAQTVALGQTPRTSTLALNLGGYSATIIDIPLQ